MKAMVCEMCQSNDLVKQNGMYVCQYCGTKYSVEEARKLFVEGTVKIDRSDEIQNLYAVARRAQKENNIANAQKYYEMLLPLEPFNWEPVFYSAYYTYTDIEDSEAGNKAVAFKKLLDSTIPLIDRLDEASRKSAFLDLQQHIYELVPRLGAASLKHYYSLRWIDRHLNERIAEAICIADPAFALGDAFRRNNMVENAAEFYKLAIHSLESSEALFDAHEKDITIQLPDDYKFAVNRMAEASNYIRLVHPSYMSRREIRYRDYSSKKRGCYVATAVYGSYDCPQVWMLRRFRDNTLAETWYGRAFIRTYYAISPTLVKWFGKTEWFKNLWKPTLDRIVEKLNESGVEDTPYVDRAW